jgi:hypothetical protein
MESASFLKIALSILFILCLLEMPYGFYQFVRFSAMVGFIYLAFLSSSRENQMAVFLYIGLAILFQPFFKIALGRTVWNFIDVIIAIGLLASLFLKNGEEKTTNEIKQ